MNLKTFCAVTLLCAGLSVRPTIAQNIIYHVVPLTFSDGAGGVYELTGTITTNGTLGLLQPSDIVDYEVDLSGLYSFSPSNPAAEITAHGGIEASANQISFVSPGGFGFTAYDNSARSVRIVFRLWAGCTKA